MRVNLGAAEWLMRSGDAGSGSTGPALVVDGEVQVAAECSATGRNLHLHLSLLDFGAGD
jgi:hypothetical protein